MENNKGRIFRKGNGQAGITLVALVVTIVVLLILAGISINLVLDNNGIITKAGEAKDKHEQGRVNDQTDLDNALDWIDEMTGANIVEPEDVDDWEYETEDDGTLTITGYKGTETEVVIPNSIDGVKVKRLYGAMSDDLTSDGIKMSIWDDSILSGEKVWQGSGCIKVQSTIKKIIISKGIEEIGDWAFAGTFGVVNIDIPNSVTRIGKYAFWHCQNLMDVVLPDSVVNVEEWTFYECSSLKTVTISDFVRSIGDYAFYECSSLSSIMLPDSLTTIGEKTFGDCTSLTSIEIPNSVTNIAGYTFSGCEGLMTIEIPDSVTSIGYNAFGGCSALTTVNYTGDERQWENITVRTGNDTLTSATIVYNYKE